MCNYRKFIVVQISIFLCNWEWKVTRQQTHTHRERIALFPLQICYAKAPRCYVINIMSILYIVESISYVRILYKSRFWKRKTLFRKIANFGFWIKKNCFIYWYAVYLIETCYVSRSSGASVVCFRRNCNKICCWISYFFTLQKITNNMFNVQLYSNVDVITSLLACYVL